MQVMVSQGLLSERFVSCEMCVRLNDSVLQLEYSTFITVGGILQWQHGLSNSATTTTSTNTSFLLTSSRQNSSLQILGSITFSVQGRERNDTCVLIYSWLQVQPVLGTGRNCKSELNKAPHIYLCDANRNYFNYMKKPTVTMTDA